MPGLYERVKEQASSVTTFNIPGLLIYSVLGGYGSAKLDANQARDQVNDWCTRKGRPLLDADEESDLQKIAAEINGKTGLAKLEYFAYQVFIAMNIAETGNVKTDDGWRNLLDITRVDGTDPTAASGQGKGK